jgi:hypothetical protein
MVWRAYTDSNAFKLTGTVAAILVLLGSIVKASGVAYGPVTNDGAVFSILVLAFAMYAISFAWVTTTSPFHVRTKWFPIGPPKGVTLGTYVRNIFNDHLSLPKEFKSGHVDSVDHIATVMLEFDHKVKSFELRFESNAGVVVLPQQFSKKQLHYDGKTNVLKSIDDQGNWEHDISFVVSLKREFDGDVTDDFDLLAWLKNMKIFVVEEDTELVKLVCI